MFAAWTMMIGGVDDGDPKNTVRVARQRGREHLLLTGSDPDVPLGFLRAERREGVQAADRRELPQTEVIRAITVGDSPCSLRGLRRINTW